MKESPFENLSEEVFDNILSFIWFQDQSSLIESSKGLRTRVLTPKVRSGMLELCLAKTGREVVDMHEEMLKLADETEDSKADTLERLKELTTRVTPYPTYFDWLANLVDWDKLVLNSSRSSSSGEGGDSVEFGRNTAKDHLVSVKLRPDGIECVELTPEETFFRGKLEPLGMNSGRRALLYQGRKLGGNRCCVANDHFPFLPAVTSDLSDEFGHGIASRMDYPQILRPSRVPFTRVLNNRPSLSCVSYFEVTIYNPRKPANGKNYTAEWLRMNPPCVAIGLAYPSPAKKKEHPRPMSRTESGDDLRSYAIDSNSALEHFDTEPDMEQEEEEEEEEHEEIVLGHQPFRLRRHLPGWDRQSIGYHGDDGNVFNGNSYQSATNITLGMREFLTRGAYGQNLKQEGSNIPSITESFPTMTCPQASSSEGKSFGRGDVVGCGIVYPPLADAFTAKRVNPGESFPHHKHEGEGIVFFVKNGKVVFMTSFNVNVPPSELPRIARPWFPVVGLDSYCPVEFNFGNSDTNPFAFDVLAFEKHLFDLRRSINSISSSSLPALNLVEELRRVPPLPPIPHSGMNVVLPEAPSSDVKEDINDSNSSGSGSGSSRANDMLAAIIRPLRVVTSLGSDTAVQQMRSGRCLRGNFIDWTRSLRIMSKTSDDKETSSYGLLPLSAGMSPQGSASPAAAEWNDGILSLLSSKGRGYYSRCADLAIDVCTCYETRRSAQPPLIGISSIGSKLSEAGSSRSRSGSNLSVSEERSRSSSRAGSFTINAKSPGHFKAWEDAGEHLSAHSLFLNSSLSAAIKSILRAYRLHSRVILDEVVKDHREGQYERVATRSRLINMFERSFNAAGGDAASQMMVDAAVEEVWQMILPDDGEEDGEEEGAESDELGEDVAGENIELGSGSEDSDDESYVDEDGEILEEHEAYELDSDEESLHTSSDEGDTEGQGVQYHGEGA